MTCLLTLVCFGSTLVNFFEKILAKLTYPAGTITSLANNNAIWVSQARYIIIIDFGLRLLICIIKALTFLFHTTWANSFLTRSSIWRVADKDSLILSDLLISFFSANYTFALLCIRQNILDITFILIMANRNVFWKNHALVSLSIT